MDPRVQQAAEVFKLNDVRGPKCFEGLSEEEAARHPGEESNPILWIFGHITGSRHNLLGFLGRPRDYPWADLLGRGAQRGDAGQYPSMSEIVPLWEQAGAALRERLEEMTGDELSADSPRPLPIDDKTLRGTINFLAYHETYHVGQMAYLRKWLGKESIVG